MNTNKIALKKRSYAGQKQQLLQVMLPVQLCLALELCPLY